MTTICQPCTKLYEINKDWVTKKEAMEILGIGNSLLRKYTSWLCDLLDQRDFDYMKYQDRGYSRRSMECLVEFRKLADKKGRVRAIQEIHDRIKEIRNGSN